jgi:hypothetical protein
MNKYITTLILGVVGLGMALVLGIHMRQQSDKDRAAPAATTVSDPANTNSGFASNAVATEGAASSTPSGNLNPGQQVPSAPPQASSTAPDTQSPAGMAPTRIADNSAGLEIPAGVVQDQPAIQAIASSPGADGGASDSKAETPDSSGQAVSPAAVQPVSPSVRRDPPPARPAEQASRQGAAAPQARSTVSAASVAAGNGNILQTSLKFRGLGMFLSIEADSPLPVKYFVLAAPDRLVIDLPGTWKNLTAPVVPQNMLVKNLRIGRQTDSDRIVIDLSRKIKNDTLIRINDKKVEIFFE